MEPHDPDNRISSAHSPAPASTTRPQSFDADVLVEEVNILRLEGRIFCFDAGEVKKRTGRIVYDDGDGRTLTIEPHPTYGQPSMGAFKVLQAIFKKITDEGLPIADTICFSEREIARLAGRTAHGGTQSLQIRDYLMQLKTCNIKAHVQDKATKEWRQVDFSIITKVLSSGKGRKLHQCVISIEPRLIESLNQKHWACLNWDRLKTLDAIPTALYHRLYLHFSNLYNHQSMRPADLKFEKDYEAIVRDWLGGMAVEAYTSRITKQLGKHLDALKASGLLKRWEIARRADGSGFKLVFLPGKTFFEDYDRFYRSRWQPQLRLVRNAEHRTIQQPHELVAYFHELLGHTHTAFEDKEIGYASLLLVDYSYDEVRDLIAFAVEQARDAHTPVQQFGWVKPYLPRWEAERALRAERKRAHEIIAECRLCDAAGYLTLVDANGAPSVTRCPHDLAQVEAFEAKMERKRVN